MKKFLSLLLLAGAVSAFAAESTPLFNAMLSVGKENRFVLVSPTGKVSSFLRTGEAFEGYVIKSYDAKTGTLSLDKDGTPVALTLVANASVGTAQLATPATLADATAVLNAMNFEEMLDKTMAGMRKQQGTMVERMMGQLPGGGGDREAVIEFQKKVMGEMMSGLNGAEMKADVAKIYSEVFSKEELQGLGSFYSSPLGKSFSDKQPEVSEKMNAVMMPRIMANMPKVTQMMQEFGREQRAKRDAAKAGGAATPAPAPTVPPAK